MLPNVYGWSWTPTHVIFIGVFACIAATIAAAVLLAWWRSARDLHAGRADAIRWHEEFHDLSAMDRRCRHEIGGRVLWRECDAAFDCRECKTHPKLRSESPPAAVYYHRGHTCVRPEPEGTLRVGLDEIALELTRTAEIELPAPGTRVRVHSPLGRVRLGEHEARILSPVDGEVIEIVGGSELRIRPHDSPLRLTHLLAGREAEMWKARERERLEAVRGLADRSRVWGTLLLEP
jgi:hypothetical protein